MTPEQRDLEPSLPTARPIEPSDGRRGAPPAVRAGDFALVLLGAVLWGTGGLAGSALASGSDLDMLGVATVRLLVGGGLLLVLLAVTGRLRRVVRGRATWRRVVTTGALAALYQGCYFVAVSLTSISIATVVALGAAPVLVAAATAVATRRRPPVRTLAAVGLALVGLVLLVGVSVSGGGRPALGVCLALVSAAGFATMTVVNSRPVPGLAPLPLTALSFTLGGVVLAVLCVVTGLGDHWGTPRGAEGWLLVAYLGLGPTALAYGAYFAGLRTVPATTASLLSLVEPLTATVGAVLLRGEAFGPRSLLGAVLLASAVVVLRPRPARVPGAAAGVTAGPAAGGTAGAAPGGTARETR
ncbi:DMT family transporter [Cellulomonas hominis]